MVTKNSIDHLLPKSDRLLTQTERQERAISEIHDDLRTKTNKIIQNIEGVESRLKKQENEVVNLSQRQIPTGLLLDPTIDRLVEYDPNRYLALNEDYTTETSTLLTSKSSSTSSPSVTIPTLSLNLQTTTPMTSTNSTATSVNGTRASTRNRGVIFPSVKNKPSLTNSTFTTDNLLANYKDIKVT